MEKNKKILGLFSLLVLTLLTFSFVSAVTTINAPVASTAVSGATTFRVNTTDVLAGAGTMVLVNFTFYAKSSLSANNTWVIIGQNNSVNVTLTGNATMNIINLSSLILEDANDYIFNVTIKNVTTGAILGEDTNIDITVDNGVPTAPTALSPTADQDSNSVAFSGTVVGANTTSCTLFFDGQNPGSSSYAMTHSGNSCTYTVNPVADQTYRYYIRASDETNTTDSSTSTVLIDTSSGSGSATASYLKQQQVVQAQKQIVNQQNQQKNNQILVIVGIIFFITLIFFIIRRNS
ncbi:MAG: hypothetical protein AABY22_23360 [Nanoarchaeota archaeon]